MSRPPAPQAPQPSRNVPPAPDAAGQSPGAPIEFTKGDDVARGNAERANAEPEPAALHDAEVPGKPDAAAERRHDAPKDSDN
ncbi:hypothetical protein BH11MYX3_BH11MYX3_17140 [soil metagenome]